MGTGTGTGMGPDIDRALLAQTSIDYLSVHVHPIDGHSLPLRARPPCVPVPQGGEGTSARLTSVSERPPRGSDKPRRRRRAGGPGRKAVVMDGDVALQAGDAGIGGATAADAVSGRSA